MNFPHFKLFTMMKETESITTYEVLINQKKFTVNTKNLTGNAIKGFVNSPDDYSVVCQSKSKDYYIGNEQMVDISQPDRNTFFTFNPATVEG